MCTALFPLIYPIACETENFGGIDIKMNVVHAQMAFDYLTLFLPRQPVKAPGVRRGR